MIPIKKYSAEEIRDITLSIAGQKMGVTKAMGLKIYAGETAYIDNKKTGLNECDVDNIQLARELYFLYDIDSDVTVAGNVFSTGRGFAKIEVTPRDKVAFINALMESGINIIYK